MYIFELLNRYINKKYIKKDNYDPLDIDESAKNDDENCEHVFLPIDSTGEILACSKCGLVIKKKDL